MKSLSIFLIFFLSNAYAIRKGQRVDLKDTSYHAHITVGKSHCSGVRIHKDFILTLSHCFRDSKSKITVKFFDSNLLISQEVSLKKITLLGTNSSDELAIMPINSTNEEFTAPIISNRTIRAKQKFTVWGFGLTTNSTAGNLHRGLMQFSTHYRPAGRHNMLVMRPTANDHIPCPGDSGGGIFDLKTRSLVGLSSFINHSFRSLKSMSAFNKCQNANRAYFIDLSQHLDVLSRYIEATNLP